MESCMVVLMSQFSAVFQCLCAADEPDDLRLFSGLQLFSSIQLFPVAPDNAHGLHKIILINTALKYFCMPLKWDSY